MIQAITKFSAHFKFGLTYTKKAIPFILKHKLWKGVGQYGWLTRLFIFLGILLGLKVFNSLMDLLSSIQSADPGAMTSSMFHLFKEVGTEGYELFFLGGFKYVVVLALEVVIIHFGGKTTEVLTGVPFRMTFKQFLSDQFRAFKMILRKYCLEIIATIALSILLKIAGLKLLESPLNFLIQCYFLGVVLMDNYFKHRGKSTKESEQIIRQYAGLATAIGMCFYFMLLIPIIGAVAGACIAAVASTLALNELKPLDNIEGKKVFFEEK